jgi:hypothetical protein
VNRKELSEVVAEATARTERAAARTETARAEVEATRAGMEVWRAKNEKAVEALRVKQEKAIAEQRALTAKLERRWAEADSRWHEERVAMREAGERQEEMVREYTRQTDAIVSELQEHRDERRALLEALFKVMDRLDRLPPPPPHLRSA